MATRQGQTDAREVLRHLSKHILLALEELSYIEAGFLLRSQLDDFILGAYFLLDVLNGLSPEQSARLQSSDNADDVDENLKPTLRRLCQLSREIGFAADPARLRENVRSLIEQLFKFVVDRFGPQEDWSSAFRDEEVLDYLENISERNMQPIQIA